MPEAAARLPLPVTLATALDERAHTHADRPALTFIDEASTTQSFAQLQLRSWQTGNVLQNAGVGRGDRVAILARNAPVFYELALAVSRLGAAMVGLNWRLAAPEIDVILANAEPAMLLVDPDLAHLISDTARATVEPAAIRSLPEFSTAVDAASTAAPTASGQADDVVFILYTSGTTGIPKGVQLTNRNMAHSAWIGEHAYGMTDTSTNLVAMPLFHVGGMGYGLSAFFGGGHTVLRRDPDPVAVVQAIEEHRVTHTFLVPAVLQAVLDLEGVEAADLSSLELLVYGASPIGDAVLRRARFRCWGATSSRPTG